MEQLLPFVAAAVLVLLIVCARSSVRPLRRLVSLGLNSCLGLAGLVAANHFGAYIGISLGINLINTVALGVLGVPGLGLLLMLKWLYSV